MSADHDIVTFDEIGNLQIFRERVVAVLGMSDAHALPLAVSTYEACHFIGLPECAVCIECFFLQGS